MRTLSAFASLYESIQKEDFNTNLFNEVVGDLKTLNLTTNAKKNPASRKKLESGEIEISDGSLYRLNQEFVIEVIRISDELDLDEIVCAEQILTADDSSQAVDQDLSLHNKGLLIYYLRRQYILQIVAYVLNVLSSSDDVFVKLTSDGGLLNNVLHAFNSIHKELEEVKALVNKAQILDNYDVVSRQNITFRRDFLVKEYDTLGTILFGLSKNNLLSNVRVIKELIDHVSSLDSDDFFIIFYLPAIINTFKNLKSFPPHDVESLHSQFIKDLESDSIYTKPTTVVLIFVFLTFFIGWCKAEPNTRAKKFDFATAVDAPMTSAVELGAIEQLMVYAAETSIVEEDKSMELFYDIRSLLEKHIPRMSPKLLLDPEYSTAVRTKSSSTESCTKFTNLSIFDYGLGDLLSTLHEFFQAFITDCAFLLTKIKNAEEDSLLSGEDLYLDDTSSKADLERFFITVYFFYASRPEYSSSFWSDKESNLYGFIEWAAKCNDTLMKSCFNLMISSLSCGSQNSYYVYRYVENSQHHSWNSIAQNISKTTDKITQLEQKLQELQQNGAATSEINAVAIDSGLSEETIILLSSYFTLIESIAYGVDEDIKNQLANTFKEIIFGFLKVRSPLLGAAFKVLSHLIPLEETQRHSYWTKLDQLIFKSYALDSSDSSYISAFNSIFTSHSEILGFLQLFSRLISIGTTNHTNEYMKFGKLSFPSNMGYGYRKTGIWPYFEYILANIFLAADKSVTDEQQTTKNIMILDIIKSSLLSFDYSVILNSVSAGCNLDLFVQTSDFYSFVQQSNATVTMNYLYNEKVFTKIFKLASIGIDELEGELGGPFKPKTLMVKDSLYIIDIMLTHEGTYAEEFYPIVKRCSDTSLFLPKSISVRGLRSFYDAIFFNLPLTAHFGLYVGSTNSDISLSSINILKKLATKFNTRNSRGVHKNILLTVFDSIDDSARIKQSFIDQLISPISGEHSLKLKLAILDFICKNLSYTDHDPTISHLLLGYQVSNSVSLGPELDTFINSKTSLLQTMVNLMIESLSCVNSLNVEYAPMRLCAEFMEIITKLCRNPLTSKITLEYLSSQNLDKLLLSKDPKVTVLSYWDGLPFNGNFDEPNSKFLNSPSVGSLLYFLEYRSLLMQFLSLSVHTFSYAANNSKSNDLIEALVSNAIHSATIFSFLDTLNLKARAPSTESFKSIKMLEGLDLNLEKVEKSSLTNGAIYDFTNLDSLIELSTRSKTYLAITSGQTSDAQQLQTDAEFEVNLIKRASTSFLAYQELTGSQLSGLHSWVQLVQIIVVDSKLSPIQRSNFILEVFEFIIPKVNDYVESRLSYSEELVSLAVFLYELYHEDRVIIDNEKTLDSRLHTLFKTCINGISTPSAALRSDFYVLGTKYLYSVLKDEALSKEVLQWLKFSNESLVETVCNDAIMGQGANRVTGILFLDALNQLASLNKVNFVLESLVKSNMLLLIIRSIQNTDEVLETPNETVTSYTILYELTIFKCVAHFLTKLAQTKAGAHALLQKNLFETIASCNFLKMDPDLGLELIFESVGGATSGKVLANLNLDNPLHITSCDNGISLFEIIVPIFQLIASVLLSSGASNKYVFRDAKKLINHFRQLIQGTLKRDALLEKNKVDSKPEGLDEFVQLITLVCTLTNYSGKPL
ncbi:unnamed protein product [Kluyveromyces dobzhanskii CBS 2104]|uniref:WGS project CCBQ000000000 data, contig 00014 n=1 Tax=Kluyveromyces dobzhanskii CBS 2104 TaxID=1427455 RepID=A0A0A8L970_9SACH|nr:unnamed protein product [Kluyveromyces dobzhanskii CBS 2104]